MTAKGVTIPGLYRKSDGRWRITATGKEFTEHDEDLAVARFRKWQQSQGGDTICITVTPKDFEDRASFRRAWGGDVALVPACSGQPEQLVLEVEESIIWPWLKRQLHERPVEIADKVGIPQLARLAELGLPKDSILLSKLWDEYEAHKKLTKDTMRRVQFAWTHFVDFVRVTTLRETLLHLVRFADHVRGLGHSDDYTRDIFKRVRRIVKFGKKRDLDPAEIDGWLLRADVLYVERRSCAVLDGWEGEPPAESDPILAEHLDALLRVATPFETAVLLCALNFCLHSSEVLSVLWKELDFINHVDRSGRRKTGIRRVGVMWDITEQALLALPRSSGAVFKSSRGRAYHPNSLRKIFAALRERAGVPKDVYFDQLRDGAYTGSFKPGVVDSSLTRAVAGHRLPQEMDKYISREPQIVKPACDAIFERYSNVLLKLKSKTPAAAA